ncbi:hypothetical protein CDAR_238071 [Caerostris darwini]|uniref:Uncharacterized protein n=1 Tax=Caerostris darwini TaxID=1538125 RepID=A0AAV4NN54_9ARAC|nr:hypothetical protein CDAR_238071 [Caerostris darwini]
MTQTGLGHCKKQIPITPSIAKPTCSFAIRTDSIITSIICPPLKLLKPFTSPKPPTNDSASSVGLISSPFISDSVPQQTPATAKAKLVPQVYSP